MDQPITSDLVTRVLSTQYEDLPSEVVAHAKRSIVNWYGVAAGASRHESIQILLDVTAEVRGSGSHHVIGRSERVGLIDAALINGTSSHTFDFDDTHLRTIHHPSAPVAPACLALAEQLGSSGREVLRAFALGAEAELRIAVAVCPAHYDVGWHVTSSTGVFGAAIAAGILLDLDREQMLNALGIAGTQSLGMREVFGTMTKPLHPGKAAAAGLEAALLARRGFTSSRRILEAPRGFARVTSTESDLSLVVSEWGSRWELLKNTFKPYACGIVLHPSIDAAAQAGEKLERAADSVASIEVVVNKYVLELTGKPTPATGLASKFSVYHAVAVAFLTGHGGEAEFSDAAVADSAVLALREKVKPVVDDRVPEHEAKLIVTKTTGERLSVEIEHATGSLENPMSDKALAAKFIRVAEPVTGAERACAALDLLWRLDELDRADSVLTVLEESAAV